MNPDGFMNAEDVARYLHLGKNKVYAMAKTGELTSYRVGRKLKFTLEDVEAYIASSRHAASGPIPHGQAPDVQDPSAAADEQTRSISEAASFGALEGDPFVIAGGDMIADLIASALNAMGTPTRRLLHDSYTAIVNLYAGEADAAVTSLYDQKTNSYNVPFARSLAPGVSVAIFRLYGRETGLIVQEGNPKGLTTWGSLLRDGVRVANRSKGSGARVLLDEKLRAMDARSETLAGYDSELTVASAAVRRVATGLADVAIGTSRDARFSAGVGFVPLQNEWVDLIVVKNPASRRHIRSLKALLADDRFRRDAQALGLCDLSKMGSIIYES